MLAKVPVLGQGSRSISFGFHSVIFNDGSFGRLFRDGGISQQHGRETEREAYRKYAARGC